jgi:hypothetical protein
MTFTIQAILFISIVAFTLVLSQWFYQLHLRIYSSAKLQKLKYSLEEFTYSLEEMIYFVTLPSMDPNLTHSKVEQIIVKPDFDSLFFPRLIGVSVLIDQQAGGRRVIAYLPLERMGTPLLDTLMMSGEINRKIYEMMSAYRMLHPSTLHEIKLEVHRRLQSRPRMTQT